ncbi:MAG: cation:proton antiporter, partial [Calditrichia bacterium]
MNEFNIGLAVLGFVLLGLELTSGLFKNKLFLSEPIVTMAAGILCGPFLLNLLDMGGWGNKYIILEEAARLTLAVALMGVAIRLPGGYLFRCWRTILIMIGLVLPLMWLVSGALAYLLLGLPVMTALLIGAIITPTDPVVASSIVTGKLAEKKIPAHVR